jgi:hypothetical protein
VPRGTKGVDQLVFPAILAMRRGTQGHENDEVTEWLRCPACIMECLEQPRTLSEIVETKDDRPSHLDPAVAASPGREIRRELRRKRLSGSSLEERNDLISLNTTG